MNYLKYILILFPVLLMAQVTDTIQDAEAKPYLIIEGDSVPRMAIDLDEVKLLHKLKFDDRKDRMRYLILRRKTVSFQKN